MTKTTCETVQPELKAYLDGMLPRLQAYSVRRHIATCENCRNELAEVERIGKELHSMAIEFNMDGDRLDPILRARILADLPAESSVAPTGVRIQSRYRPIMVIGALASAAVVAAIILPQHLFPLLSAHTQLSVNEPMSKAASSSAGAKHNTWDRQAVAGAPASAPALKAVVPAPNQAYLAETDSSAVPAGTGTRSAMQDGHLADRGGSPQVVDGIDAKMPATVIGKSAPGVTGFAPVAVGGASVTLAGGRSSLRGGRNSGTVATVTGNQAVGGFYSQSGAAREIHTFASSNLRQGEEQVRSAVISFQGTVLGRPQSTDADTIVLTVTISAERAAALVAAIPALSGGALIAQPALARAKMISKAGRSGSDSRFYVPPNRDTASADSLQVRASPGGSGNLETRSGGEAHKQPGGGSRAAGNPNALFGAAAASKPTAMKTITIVLVKVK